jgi:general secretion pathway protein A
MLATQFGLGDRAATSKATMLRELESILTERRVRAEITALVVDEAQSLSLELLEEIRLLANIETPTMKLLPLVLAGQPELADRLNDPGLRQLKQRIALRCEIKPLELQETAAYVAFRVRRAGGEPSRLFTREAVVLIHEHSHGIPRTISVMCDNALLNGMALGRQPVDKEIVFDVCRDFDLAGPTLAASSEPVFVEEPLGQHEPIATADDRAADDPDAEAKPARLFARGSQGRFALFGTGRPPRGD